MLNIYLSKAKFLFTGFFFWFYIFLSAQTQGQDYQSIANKSYGEIHSFLFDNFHNTSKIYSSDSADYFREVDKLRMAAEKVNNRALVLESRFLRFLYLSSQNYPDYLKELKAFLETVDEAGIPYLQGRVRQALGLHYFHHQNNYGKAFMYMTESYPFLKDIPLEELPDKQELLYNIGYVYYNIGYAFKAIQFFEEAEILDNTYYKSLKCNIINAKGLIYEARGNNRKASEYFHEAIKEAQRINHPVWLRISQDNLSVLLFKEKKYDEAKVLLTSPPLLSPEDTEEFVEIESRRLTFLAEIAVAKENWDELSAITQKIKNLPQWEFKVPLKSRKDIYRLLATDQKQQLNFEKASLYSDTALVLATQYFELKSNEGLKLALEKERIDFVLDQKNQAAHQKKLNLITVVSLLIILGLILAISIILFRRQKGIYKKKRKKVEHELVESKVKLEELVRDINNKNKEVQAFEEELQQLYNEINKDDSRINEKQKTLEDLLSKPILTDTKWVVFKRAFDRVYPDYYQKIQAAIPNISPAETRYMYLRKLNLTAKEIAYVLGISQGSIRQYKHRIRTKIQLESAIDLEEFLDNIQ